MKQQPPSKCKYEYRVVWQRIHWKQPRTKLYQVEAYAIRLADRVDEGQDRYGLLKELKIERRLVGSWVEHHDQ